MRAQVPASLYFPDTVESVIARMRDGYMPAPFVRRMRLVNLISAAVLRKIEPELLAPFDVEDLHHILDKQISQDAVIDQLDSEAVATGLTSGDLSLLQGTANTHPLLRTGLASGWMNLFFNRPFDPICVMLAMLTKLLLDAIDEMGHSYNLIRMIGFGWIDFGEIPGETPGEPGDYYPPAIDNPIVIPPAGGEPGPGAPGYAPPGPVQPIYAPGGPPGQLGGPLGSMAAPSGYLDQGIFTGPAGGGGGAMPAVNCCLDKDNPHLYITIYPLSMTMDCGDTQTFMVTQYNPICAGSHYTWFVTPDAGTLVQSGDYQVDYTAPDGGAECPPAVAILLYCGGALVDSITITFNPCPVSAEIDCDTSQINVDGTITLTATIIEPGAGTPSLVWDVAGGEDHLNAHAGLSVVYTVPTPDPDWSSAPTITLSCGDNPLDAVTLAIHANKEPSSISEDWDFTGGPYYYSAFYKPTFHGIWKTNDLAYAAALAAYDAYSGPGLYKTINIGYQIYPGTPVTFTDQDLYRFTFEYYIQPENQWYNHVYYFLVAGKSYKTYATVQIV